MRPANLVPAVVVRRRSDSNLVAGTASLFSRRRLKGRAEPHEKEASVSRRPLPGTQQMPERAATAGGTVGGLLAHSIHEGVQEGMMGGDEAVGLA
jgi:hypothetical protein